MNTRLIAPDRIQASQISNLNSFDSSTRQADVSIPMHSADKVVFSWTYKVHGTDFACSTPTFKAEGTNGEFTGDHEGEQILGRVASTGAVNTTVGTPSSVTNVTVAGQRSANITVVRSTPNAVNATVVIPAERVPTLNATLSEGEQVALPRRNEPRRPRITQAPPLLTVVSAVCPNLNDKIKLAKKSTHAELAQFSVVFVNEDSKMLDWIDLHYKVNEELFNNFKLGSDTNQTDVIQRATIELQPSDKLTFFVTYKVADVDFACDSNFVTMQAKSIGKEVSVETKVTHKEQQVRDANSRDANIEPTPAPHRFD